MQQVDRLLPMAELQVERVDSLVSEIMATLTRLSTMDYVSAGYQVPTPPAGFVPEPTTTTTVEEELAAARLHEPARPQGAEAGEGAGPAAAASWTSASRTIELWMTYRASRCWCASRRSTRLPASNPPSRCPCG
jgi:hypothetical protein